jgi:hypothetical protein
MAEVRVRAEQATVDLGWHEVAQVERTEWIDSMIEDGRLVEVDDEGNPTETVLRGEALDRALRAEGLSTSGKAEDKRARLSEHRTAQRAESLPVAEDPNRNTKAAAPSGISPGTQTGGSAGGITSVT